MTRGKQGTTLGFWHKAEEGFYFLIPPIHPDRILATPEEQSRSSGIHNEKTEDMAISTHVSGDVERNGIEPFTSTMPLLRSTN